MKKFIIRFIKTTAFTLAVASGFLLGCTYFYSKELPESFQLTAGQTLTIGANNQVQASLNYTEAYDGKAAKATLSLFGVIPIKEVSVKVVDKKCVALCGTPFGIKMFTDGVLVVGMTDVDTKNGLVNPAKNAGIKIGDVIISIDGTKVHSNESVAELIEKSDGAELTLLIHRQNLSFNIKFRPEPSESENKYKAGLWVRDSSAGIGTLTFFAPETGIAAGLGHGICDVDTGELLPISSGELVPATILDIIKGKKGEPGELRGKFVAGKTMGSLMINNETGVYGHLESSIRSEKLIDIAMRQEVKPGKAKILTTIDSGDPKYYDCMIEKVNYDKDTPTQNLSLRITDSELIEKTGGIVQGMSGSPIIQNDKLVGAVTHVFVNDSARGYGIFAETMLAHCDDIDVNLLRKAS